MGEGRRLLSITKDGLTTSYQYDASGNRIRVTYPDGSYTKYCILDGRVIGEIVYKSTSSGVQWSHGVRYIYGDDGSVVGFGIWDADTTDEWERYYFVKNLQGDVLKVYRDADNALVASYEYDPFGRVLSATGEMADENPFRYRGYHYDTNTGFYYLQSRYYDPLICRFINADSYASTGQGVLGYNMFAYCNNNPVNYIDKQGDFCFTFWVGVAAASISGICNAISTAANGGSLQECLVAGAVGFASGAIGYIVAFATGFTPAGNLLGRAVSSTLSDLGTAYALNGEVTSQDLATTFVDVTMDVCFSTLSYYYTDPIKGKLFNTIVNSALDGIADIAETLLFQSQKSTNNTQSTGDSGKTITGNSKLDRRINCYV